MTMNKSAIAAVVLVALCIGAGYYLWSADTTDPVPALPAADAGQDRFEIGS